MMYHQIGIKLQKDINLFNTIFRASPEEDLSVYVYAFLVMGSSDAQFQSVSAIHKVADLVEEDMPKVAAILRTMYMDDGTIFGESAEETSNLLKNTITVLESYNFITHKILTDDRDIVKDFPKEKFSVETKNVTKYEKEYVHMKRVK